MLSEDTLLYFLRQGFETPYYRGTRDESSIFEELKEKGLIEGNLENDYICLTDDGKDIIECLKVFLRLLLNAT